MSTTFADRLWWARHRKRWGADILSQKAGCAQSLISSIERNNRDRCKYTDEFARVLNVDPHWLQFGTGNAPPGFNEKEASDGRKSPKKAGQLFRLPDNPRWAERKAAVSAAISEESLTHDFSTFARGSGKERAKALIKLFEHVLELIFFEEKAEGHNKIASIDKGHNRP